MSTTPPKLVTDRGMPDWRVIYEHMPVESMPWFNPNLDPDLARAIDALGLRGGAFLDLGTGPGTQAIELARLGFTVTGTDVSSAAIAQARARAAGASVQFVVDDVLATTLREKFDAIFDRGCFHVFEESEHARYLASLLSLLKPDGIFFLKCFSTAEPGDVGPRRSTPEDLRRIFGANFSIESIEETVYYGNVSEQSPIKHQPRSLFAVMRYRQGF